MRVEKKEWKKPLSVHRHIKPSKGDFGAVLERQKEEVYRRSLEEKLKEVDDAALALKDMLTEERVRVYQEKVRAFMSQALAEAYSVLPQRKFDRKGKQKMMLLCNTVDEKLVEILDLFVREQAPYLKILRLLDEIRGLLVDFII